MTGIYAHMLCRCTRRITRANRSLDPLPVSFRFPVSFLFPIPDFITCRHRDVAGKFDISGFPTLKFFPKTNKDGESYEGGRTTANFVNFLNEKAGTQRLPGGKLSDQAGMVEEMNEFASRFMSESEEREKIISEASTVADSHDDPNAGYYVKVMKKIQDKGDEYIKNEDERLGRILGGAISDKKNDEISKKRNVLKKFEL